MPRSPCSTLSQSCTDTVSELRMRMRFRKTLLRNAPPKIREQSHHANRIVEIAQRRRRRRSVVLLEEKPALRFREVVHAGQAREIQERCAEASILEVDQPRGGAVDEDVRGAEVVVAKRRRRVTRVEVTP